MKNKNKNKKTNQMKRKQPPNNSYLYKLDDCLFFEWYSLKFPFDMLYIKAHGLGHQQIHKASCQAMFCNLDYPGQQKRNGPCP